MKPRLATSSCLLGHKVRYDGKDTFHDILNYQIIPNFEIVHFCPEMEMGLGVPRETIQLVKINGQVELMPNSRLRPLTLLARDTFNGFDLANIDGYILQSRSPSCGLGTTKLYEIANDGEEKLIDKNSSGLFAEFLLDNFPGLPLLDSADLEKKDKLTTFLNAVDDHFRNRVSK